MALIIILWSDLKVQLKWLDLQTLFLYITRGQHHTVTEIKYFMTGISLKGDPDAPNRQDAYLKIIELPSTLRI